MALCCVGNAYADQVPPQANPTVQDIKDSVIVHFPTKHQGKHIEGAGHLFMPPDFKQGHAPVPIMFILHGSLGIMKGREDTYARELAKMGVAAFIIDSFGPRGISVTVDDQSQIANKDFLRDAFSALKTLGKDSRIDATRAGIMGFSRGGSIALVAAYQKQRKAFHVGIKNSFKAHYLYYPGCSTRFYNKATTGAPITFFLGENDRYTGVAPCVDLADELLEHRADVTTIIYKGAGHDWDLVGSAHYPLAEVRMNCRFEEQADGTWNEKTSGIQHMPDLYGSLFYKALEGCRTRGVTIEGNAKVRQEAMDALKALFANR